MNYHVLTLFPEMIEQAFHTSITGRAAKEGTITLETVNIRDFSEDERHHKVDDYPYGGGAGMVMQPEPVYKAYEDVLSRLKSRRRPRVIYLTPQGRVFNQDMAMDFAQSEDLIFLCGHYEGIDERVLDEIVTDQVSIGDFVLTGGELASLIMMDAISRLVPGVLGNDISSEDESFHNSLLEYPQYTRPEVWHEKAVPAALLSGDHKQIASWRYEAQIERTRDRRPDLYEEYCRREELAAFLKSKKRPLKDLAELLRTDAARLISKNEDKEIVFYSPNKGLAFVYADLHETDYASDFAKMLREKYPDSVSGNRIYLHTEDEISDVSFLNLYCYTQANPLPINRLVKDSEKGFLSSYCVFEQIGGGVFEFQTDAFETLYKAFYETYSDAYPGITKLSFLNYTVTDHINRLVYERLTPVLYVPKDFDLFDSLSLTGFYKSAKPVYIL